MLRDPLGYYGNLVALLPSSNKANRVVPLGLAVIPGLISLFSIVKASRVLLLVSVLIGSWGPIFFRPTVFISSAGFLFSSS